MSDNPILVATTRTEFGKGAARRARRAQMVPGVVYGHGETTHLAECVLIYAADPFHILPKEFPAIRVQGKILF